MIIDKKEENMDFYELLKQGGFSLNSANFIPEEYKIFASLFFYVLIIVAYSIFVWRFHKFISKRDMIELNLKKYNRLNNAFFEKIFAIIFYTIEYIVIIPFLVIFWFSVFSVLIMIIAKSLDYVQILVISAAIIASIRITSYMSPDLSKNIAKIIPFTLLAIFILSNDKILDLKGFLTNLSQIPSFFNNIFMFLVFLIIVEFILRVLYSIGQFFSFLGFNKQDKLEESLKQKDMKQTDRKIPLKKLENYR